MLSLQHGVILGIRQGTLLYESADIEALSMRVASKGNPGSLLVLKNNDAWYHIHGW